MYGNEKILICKGKWSKLLASASPDIARLAQEGFNGTWKRDTQSTINALFYSDPEGICLAVKAGWESGAPHIEADYKFTESLRTAQLAVSSFLQRPLSGHAAAPVLIPANRLQQHHIKALNESILFSDNSIGMAAAVLFLARELKQEIPADVAFTAAITLDGRFEPVGHVDEKINAVQQDHHYIKRIILSPHDAAQYKSTPGFDGEVIGAANLDELCVLIWGEPIRNELEKVRLDLNNLLVEYRNRAQLQDYGTATKILDQIIEKYSKPDLPSVKTRLAWVFAHRGIQYTHEGKGIEAENNFQKALQFMNELGDDWDPTIEKHAILNTYGVWLTDNYRIGKGKEIFEQALQMMAAYRIPNYKQIEVLNSYGQLLTRTPGGTGLAAGYEKFKTALNFARQNHEYTFHLPRLFCYFAENRILMGKKDEAFEYLNKAEHARALQPTDAQYFFNRYYRCYLGLYFNDYTYFQRAYQDLAENNLLSEKSPHVTHVGIIEGFAAVMSALHENREELQERKAHALAWVTRTNILNYILLIKIEALGRLHGSGPVLFSNEQMSEALQLARREALEPENIPDGRLVREEKWQELAEHIIL